MRKTLVVLMLALLPALATGQTNSLPYQSGATTLATGSPAGSMSYYPATLRTGLQAYYKMEESTGADRNDSVGSVHMHDGLGTVAQVAGKNGNAAQTSVAGANYLYVSGFTLGSSWTVSLWFNHDDAARAADATFHILNAPWPNNTQVAIYFGTSTVMYALVGDGAAFQYAQATPIAVDANWHHVIAWFDASDKIVHISVDGGGETAGTALAGTPYRTSAVVGTGFSTVGGPISSNAIVDEVAIWSRVLTPFERSAIYNTGSGRFYPF